MQEQDNFNTNIEAEINDNELQPWNILVEVQVNDPVVIGVELQKIKKNINFQLGVALMMLVQMAIALIELMKDVSYTAGPNETFQVPGIPTWIIISPLVIILLVLVFLTQCVTKSLGKSYFVREIVMFQYFQMLSVALLISMWIFIYSGSPAWNKIGARYIGVLMAMVDMIAGIIFIFLTCTGCSVLVWIEKQLSTSLQSGLKMPKISIHQ